MPPPEDPEGPKGEPEYRVYRSRKPLLGRRDGGGESALAKLRSERAPKQPKGSRPEISGRRVAKWVATFVACWIALAVVAFLISAQIQQGKVGDQTNELLGGAGYPLWSANTVLVLGSDQRTKGTREPGAQTTGGRSDSIMLMRVGAGANSRMSIARDTIVDIPGHGRGKINSAFAYGGAALATKTVEQFTGVDVNHVVLVSFENFPSLIDAMGGITYKGGCVVSRINGGFRNGGFTLRLRAGKTHIDGKQALALARTRHNDCNRHEDDLTRARRQQKVISAMKRRLLSPFAFVRLPMIGWAAPKSLRSDMSGPTLLGLFASLTVSGSPKTQVLGTQSGTIPDDVRRRAVRRFLAG